MWITALLGRIPFAKLLQPKVILGVTLAVLIFGTLAWVAWGWYSNVQEIESQKENIENLETRVSDQNQEIANLDAETENLKDTIEKIQEIQSRVQSINDRLEEQKRESEESLIELRDMINDISISDMYSDNPKEASNYTQKLFDTRLHCLEAATGGSDNDEQGC